MHKLGKIGAAALMAAVLAGPAYAAGLSVTNAWFRALPEGLPAAGYFTLHNGRSVPVVVTGARSSSCGMLMLHRSSEKSGTSRMDDVTSVTVPAGGTFMFAPGGYHLMCTNPRAGMTPGSSVEVTLSMAGGATIGARFAVRGATGK